MHCPDNATQISVCPSSFVCFFPFLSVFSPFRKSKINHQAYLFIFLSPLFLFSSYSKTLSTDTMHIRLKIRSSPPPQTRTPKTLTTVHTTTANPIFSLLWFCSDANPPPSRSSCYVSSHSSFSFLLQEFSQPRHINRTEITGTRQKHRQIYLWPPPLFALLGISAGDAHPLHSAQREGHAFCHQKGGGNFHRQSSTVPAA